MSKSRIIGTGSYLPAKVLSNADLERMVETTDEWIVSRTGIKERRIAAADEFPSDMGAAAAKQALEAAGLDASAIDMILVGTMTPEYLSPSTAALIQHKIGAKRAAAMDLQAACSGYLYCLSAAKAYVDSGMYRNVLVIATEKMSAVIDYKDRGTCVLFGDGASATVISGEGNGLAIDTVYLGADGEFADLIMIPGGGARHPATKETVEQGLHYFKMSGREVFKHAVRKMDAAAQQCLGLMNLTIQDMRWIVPHQANIRILEALSQFYHVPEHCIYKTIQKYGNTSAASVPTALDELIRNHPLQKGEHLLLIAAGGGFTWGASILTQM